MPTNSVNDEVTERPRRDLTVLSGLLIAAGSLLITIAALIKWWPVSPVLFVLGAAVFWTLVAVTAKADPNDVQLDLRDA